MDKLNAVRLLYEKIHKCEKCFNILNGNIRFDSQKVQRRVFSNIINSKLFIVAQSLASNQLRLSGTPFHNTNEQMSSGGIFLEKYLNRVGYTVSPKRKDLVLVYTTDAVQCYPGKKRTGSGDNIPIKQEIKNCRSWLLEEVYLMKPKVILLFGKSATKTFFEYFLNKSVSSLSEYFYKSHLISINKIDVLVHVLPHPTSMVKDKGKIFDKAFTLIGNDLEIR